MLSCCWGDERRTVRLSAQLDNADGDPQMRVSSTTINTRKQKVLSNLRTLGTADLEAATQGLDLNYNQKITLMKSLVNQGTVKRVGKDGAKVLYQRSIPRATVQKASAHLGQQLTVTGAHMDGAELIWELETPAGGILSVRLLESPVAA